ncbi:hypothetical protein ACH4TY_21755 [Streptomyces anulatus]
MPADAPAPSAVGHRIVHGGSELRGHRLIDDGVHSAPGRAAALAPLHVPPTLTVGGRGPRPFPTGDVPNVRCLRLGACDTRSRYGHVPPRRRLLGGPAARNEAWSAGNAADSTCASARRGTRYS